MSEIPYAALIGLDWADQKHDVCLSDCTTHTQEHGVIGARPEAIEAWAMQLRVRYGGRPIAVCLKQKRGPLIYALCKYEFLVLYPVNPQTVSKYRPAFTPRRAKDDPTVGVASSKKLTTVEAEGLTQSPTAWCVASDF